MARITTSVVLRGGTVLTLDAQHSVLPGADVLVTGDRVAAVGTDLAVPEGTREIDARDGIVMPGMIDTHRHMWQTAMRGYGADWTLTQYFVWYYLESGKHFRPQDVRAGNLLAAAEALDAGVTTCVDWSHGLQTVGHAEAAVDALRIRPRPLRAGLRQHPAGPVGVVGLSGLPGVRPPDARRRLGWASRWPSTSPATRRSRRRPRTRWRASWACPSPRTPGVWGATNDDGIRLAHEAGFLDASSIFVHAAHAVGRLLPPHRGHRRLGVGVHGERAERGPGLPAHVGAARPRHPGVAVDGHQRVVERRPVLRDAHHAGRRPFPRALRSPPEGRHDHPLLAARGARRRLGHPRRGRGAGPVRRSRQPGAGQEGRCRAAQERRVAGCRSRCSTPTATSRSRPSAATCTRCWWTGGW